MSKHWTSYMMGEATQKQADYLDQLAAKLDAMIAQRPASATAPWREVRDGRGLLEWSGVKGAPTKTEASQAIDFALAKIGAREKSIASASPDARAEAIAKIRDMMGQHGISAADLG